MKDTHITAMMTVISSDGTTPLHEQVVGQKQVSVQINYPKDFKGDKFFTEGHVVHNMAEDSAERLVKAGIATIVTGETDDEGMPAKSYSKMNKAELQEELSARDIEFDIAYTKAELVQLLETDDETKN